MGSCLKSSRLQQHVSQPRSKSQLERLNQQKKTENFEFQMQQMQRNLTNNKQKKQSYRELLRKIKIKKDQQKQTFQESKGLPNLGNTCFLNSIVQFLFSAEEFRHIIMSQSEKQFKLKQILSNIFTAILQTGQKQLFAKTVCMTDLIQYLKKEQIDYASNSQQDCLQFLLFILNKLQEEDEQYLKLFEIIYDQICNKPSCKQHSTLRQFYLTNNYDRCPSCNSRCQIKLISKPQYVVILNMKKQNKQQQLKFMNKKNQDLKYELKSQIFYTGQKGSGHYISRRKKLNPCKRQKDKFFYFNDDKIQNRLQEFLGFSTIASLYQIKLEELKEQKIQSYQSPRKQQTSYKQNAFNPSLSYKQNQKNQLNKEFQALKQKKRKDQQILDRQISEQQAKKNVNIPQKDKTLNPPAIIIIKKEDIRKNNIQDVQIKDQSNENKNNQLIKVKSPQKTNLKPKFEKQYQKDQLEKIKSPQKYKFEPQKNFVNRQTNQIQTEEAKIAREESMNRRNQNKNSQKNSIPNQSQHNQKKQHLQKTTIFKISAWVKNKQKKDSSELVQIYFIQQKGNRIQVENPISLNKKEHQLKILPWSSNLDKSVQDFFRKKAQQKLKKKYQQKSHKKKLGY